MNGSRASSANSAAASKPRKQVKTNSRPSPKPEPKTRSGSNAPKSQPSWNRTETSITSRIVTSQTRATPRIFALMSTPRRPSTRMPASETALHTSQPRLIPKRSSRTKSVKKPLVAVAPAMKQL